MARMLRGMHSSLRLALLAASLAIAATITTLIALALHLDARERARGVATTSMRASSWLVALVLVAMLPVVALTWGLSDASFHTLMLWFVVPTSVLGFAFGYHAHRGAAIVLLGAAAIRRRHREVRQARVIDPEPADRARGLGVKLHGTRDTGEGTWQG